VDDRSQPIHLIGFARRLCRQARVSSAIYLFAGQIIFFDKKFNSRL
jgi:hypothetical protein